MLKNCKKLIFAPSSYDPNIKKKELILIEDDEKGDENTYPNSLKYIPGVYFEF